MRPIDAHELERKVEPDEYYHSNEVKAMIEDAPTIDQLPNPPLTLEELREMGQSGLAVWCVDSDGIAQGLLCMRENWSDSRITPHIWMLDDECNSGVYSVEYMLELGAKFYRRKPEEGTV